MNRVIETTKMMITRVEEEIEVHVDGYVLFTTDTRYGEDADGNRGEARTFVEDVEEVSAYDVFGNEIELTEDEMETAKQSLADKFLVG
jgi:hypothetical protein